MIHKVLLQRYDNEPDILAVKQFGCSDVYQRAADNSFEYIIVIPTQPANTDLAIFAEAISGQYDITKPLPWPGPPKPPTLPLGIDFTNQPNEYRIRVDVANVCNVSANRVREEFERVGRVWAAKWQVMTVGLDLSNIIDGFAP